MSNPSKRKGTEAERKVVEYLQTNGFPYAERRALAGALDKGDVTGVPGVVIEVKNHAALDLAGWLNELMREVDNAQARYGAVVAKRRGHGDPAQWYAIMPFETLVRMLADLDE
jgi:hypothetical protein